MIKPPKLLLRQHGSRQKINPTGIRSCENEFSLTSACLCLVSLYDSGLCASRKTKPLGLILIWNNNLLESVAKVNFSFFPTRKNPPGPYVCTSDQHSHVLELGATVHHTGAERGPVADYKGCPAQTAHLAGQEGARLVKPHWRTPLVAHFPRPKKEISQESEGDASLKVGRFPGREDGGKCIVLH